MTKTSEAPLRGGAYHSIMERYTMKVPLSDRTGDEAFSQFYTGHLSGTLSIALILGKKSVTGLGSDTTRIFSEDLAPG